MSTGKINKVKKKERTLYRFICNNKEILFFGCKHSWNVDFQVNQIKEIFYRFNPNLVIVEHEKIPKANSEHEAILKYGEVGLVSFLALKRKVKVIPGDPKKELIVKNLLKKYSKKYLFLFFTLRSLNQYKKVRIKPSFNKFLKYTIKKNNKLLGSNFSYKDFLEIFEEVFRKKFKIKILTDDLFNPNKKLAITNLISKEVSTLRDEYLISLLIKYKRYKKYKKILIVRGKGHIKFFIDRIPKVLCE